MKKRELLRKVRIYELNGNLEDISKIFKNYEDEYEDVFLNTEDCCYVDGNMCFELTGVREETNKEKKERLKGEAIKAKKEEARQKLEDEINLKILLIKYPDGFNGIKFLRDKENYDKSKSV